MKLLNRRLPVVFAICYTSYSIVYIARLSMTMGISPLIEMGFLTKSQAGITGTVFFCVFAMGRLVNGALGDHFRPGRFLATGLMINGDDIRMVFDLGAKYIARSIIPWKAETDYSQTIEDYVNQDGAMKMRFVLFGSTIIKNVTKYDIIFLTEH